MTESVSQMYLSETRPSGSVRSPAPMLHAARRRRWAPLRWLAAMLLLVAGWAGGAATVFGQAAAPLEDIRKALGSDDFATREAAQEQLRKVAPEQLDLLKQMAADEKDPEIQARLNTQIRLLQLPVLHGGVGLGTWDTAAQFKDILVQSGDDKKLTGDFADSMAGWKVTGGQWQAAGGLVTQSSRSVGCQTIIGDVKWANYTYSLKAKRTAGTEGFLIIFAAEDDRNLTWWNIGGWGNTRTAIERTTKGSKKEIPGSAVDLHIESDKWYDIKIELHGATAKLFFDGKLITTLENDTARSALADAGPPKVFNNGNGPVGANAPARPPAPAGAIAPAAAANPPRANNPALVPTVTVTLIARKATQVIDPAQAGAAFRDGLAKLKPDDPLPATPTVDLVLRVTNKSQNLLLSLGDHFLARTNGGAAIALELKGPGAQVVEGKASVARGYQVGAINLAPGDSADIPITNLVFEADGKVKCAYWTAPGEYTLTASLTSKYFTRRGAVIPQGPMGFSGPPPGQGDLKLTTDPVTIKVTDK